MNPKAYLNFKLNPYPGDSLDAIDWSKINGIEASAHGSCGVFFCQVDNHIVVIKGSDRIAADCYAERLAALLHVRTPRWVFIERANAATRNCLVQLIKQITPDIEQHPEKVAPERTLKELFYTAGGQSRAFQRPYLVIMEYIPGKTIFSLDTDAVFGKTPCQPNSSGRAKLQAIGRMIGFDMLVNNWDRFSIKELWRHPDTNWDNILFLKKYGTVFAIDNSISCFPTNTPRFKEYLESRERFCKGLLEFTRDGRPFPPFQNISNDIKNYSRSKFDIGDAGMLELQAGCVSCLYMASENLTKNVLEVILSQISSKFTNPKLAKVIGLNFIKIDFLDAIISKIISPLLKQIPKRITLALTSPLSVWIDDRRLYYENIIFNTVDISTAESPSIPSLPGSIIPSESIFLSEYPILNSSQLRKTVTCFPFPPGVPSIHAATVVSYELEMQLKVYGSVSAYITFPRSAILEQHDGGIHLSNHPWVKQIAPICARFGVFAILGYVAVGFFSDSDNATSDSGDDTSVGFGVRKGISAGSLRHQKQKQNSKSANSAKSKLPQKLPKHPNHHHHHHESRETPGSGPTVKSVDSSVSVSNPPPEPPSMLKMSPNIKTSPRRMGIGASSLRAQKGKQKKINPQPSPSSITLAQGTENTLPYIHSPNSSFETEPKVDSESHSSDDHTYNNHPSSSLKSSVAGDPGKPTYKKLPADLSKELATIVPPLSPFRPGSLTKSQLSPRRNISHPGFQVQRYEKCIVITPIGTIIEDTDSFFTGSPIHPNTKCTIGTKNFNLRQRKHKIPSQRMASSSSISHLPHLDLPSNRRSIDYGSSETANETFTGNDIDIAPLEPDSESESEPQISFPELSLPRGPSKGGKTSVSIPSTNPNQLPKASNSTSSDMIHRSLLSDFEIPGEHTSLIFSPVQVRPLNLSSTMGAWITSLDSSRGRLERFVQIHRKSNPTIIRCDSAYVPESIDISSNGRSSPAIDQGQGNSLLISLSCSHLPASLGSGIFDFPFGEKHFFSRFPRFQLPVRTLDSDLTGLRFRVAYLTPEQQFRNQVPQSIKFLDHQTLKLFYPSGIVASYQIHTSKLVRLKTRNVKAYFDRFKDRFLGSNTPNIVPVPQKISLTENHSLRFISRSRSHCKIDIYSNEDCIYSFPTTAPILSLDVWKTGIFTLAALLASGQIVIWKFYANNHPVSLVDIITSSYSFQK